MDKLLTLGGMALGQVLGSETDPVNPLRVRSVISKDGGHQVYFPFLYGHTTPFWIECLFLLTLTL